MIYKLDGRYVPWVTVPSKVAIDGNDVKMLAGQVLVPTHIRHQGHLWLIQSPYSSILFISEYLQCQGSHWSGGVETASGVRHLGEVGPASVPVQIITSITKI